MENIDKILKLKKQMVEKSLATKIKTLEMTTNQTQDLKAAREKAAFSYTLVPTGKRTIQGIDLLTQADWIASLNTKLQCLQQRGNELHMQIENIKAELHELTVKSELIEKKIAQDRFVEQRIRSELTEDQRLETWVLKSNAQAH